MKYEMDKEDTSLTSEKVLLALNQIIANRIFARSERLSRFLRFVVELELEGKASELKEYTIATKVYDRRDDFDPAADTIVRSEARRLRRKLKEYYGTEGKEDEVVIGLLPGNYVPVYQAGRVAENNLAEESVSIAVEPFECDASNPLAWECAFGISDEILHHLTNFAGIRVICGAALASSRDGQIPDEDGAGRRARVVIRGTVRADDNILRVTARATSANSQLLWSHRVDSLVRGNTSINLQESVASDVLNHISLWLRGPAADAVLTPANNTPSTFGLSTMIPSRLHAPIEFTNSADTQSEWSQS